MCSHEAPCNGINLPDASRPGVASANDDVTTVGQLAHRHQALCLMIAAGAPAAVCPRLAREGVGAEVVPDLAPSLNASLSAWMPTSPPTDRERFAPDPVDTAYAPDVGEHVAAGLTFLIAEDHAFQRCMMVDILEQLGARAVHEAQDGAAALALLQGGDPVFDIIVTDIDMPGMDGMALMRAMGESGVTASLIINSSLDRALLDSIGTMSAAYGLHLLGTIEKPASRTRIGELVSMHRHRKAAPDLGHAPASFTLDEVLSGLLNGEFEPFYQPKVELAGRRIAGVEALARWRHPRYGVLSPDAFIPLLEGSGHIGHLTLVILATAAGQCQQWIDAGFDVCVSVNLSIGHLGVQGVDAALTASVVDSGLDPRRVILEITESVAMTNVGPVLESLNRLRMKGFRLSIDDYGTGYSSMQQLARIPFTELKIDRSFVDGASRKESSRVILESSLAMARRLNITSVAEGVETQSDWDLLHEFGCDQAQGSFVAKPMPARDFPTWAEQWRGI